jgi:hypothetical protein
MDRYHHIRHRYLPEEVKLIIVAESPPVSGLYFATQPGVCAECSAAGAAHRLLIEYCQWTATRPALATSAASLWHP